MSLSSEYIKENVSSIIIGLFDAERIQNVNRIDAIIEANDRYLNEVYNAVKYKSANYYKSGSVISVTAVGVPDLNRDLHPEMDAFLASKMTYQRDYRLVDQLLFTMTKDVRTEQDLRNCIPDTIVRFASDPEIRTMQRTLPLEDYLQDNPRAYRQYLTNKLMIDVYSASQLLY
jgi:hypothetical protein